MGHAFYRGSESCAIVFDITDRKSFENVNSWYQAFLDYGVVTGTESFPILLVGNKSDLDADRAVTKEEAEKWCASKNDKS